MAISLAGNTAHYTNTWKVKTPLEQHVWKEKISCLWNSFTILMRPRMF